MTAFFQIILQYLKPFWGILFSCYFGAEVDSESSVDISRIVGQRRVARKF